MFRALAVATALTLVAVVPVTAAMGRDGGADASDTSCHGKAATLVGSPGEDLKGTDGADIIITDGASSVEAGAGDDLICVTGATGYVNDGTGNDTVDTTAEPAGAVVLTMLSAGDDTLVGGPNTDDVTVTNGGDDHISTGGGDDHVQVADASTSPADGDVTVDLGAGDDQFSALVLPTGSTIAGGSGNDRIEPPSDPGKSSASWVYDDVEGQARRNGDVVASWSGFETFNLLLTGSNVTFYGNDGPETVHSTGDTRAAYAMGGGNDVADVGMDARFSVNGGPGEDTIAHGLSGFRTGDKILMDLFHQRVTFDPTTGRSITGAITGIEDASVSKVYQADLAGDNAANKLLAIGVCKVTMQGRDGSDSLSLTGSRPGCPGAHLNGGRGNDRLLGGSADDRLMGGPGHDVADGGLGVNECQAEVETDCPKK